MQVVSIVIQSFFFVLIGMGFLIGKQDLFVTGLLFLLASQISIAAFQVFNTAERRHVLYYQTALKFYLILSLSAIIFTFLAGLTPMAYWGILLLVGWFYLQSIVMAQRPEGLKKRRNFLPNIEI